MDSLINADVMKFLLVGMCAISCIVGVILVILGFSSLEATEFGLDYSWISKTVNPDIKTNGLYFLGIGHSFIKFPKNVQTVEFSHDRSANRPTISSRTSDGLEATKYTAYQFFMDRGPVKDDFLNTLNKEVSKICFTNIQFLQLRTVGLPTLFEDAIQESEVKKQDISKAHAELMKVEVEVDTRIKSANYQKTVAINRAEGMAEAMIQENNADVKSLIQVQTAKSKSYTNLKKELGMTNTALVNFIKAKLIKQYDGHNMALNLNSPENILNK